MTGEAVKAALLQQGSAAAQAAEEGGGGGGKKGGGGGKKGGGSSSKTLNLKAIIMGNRSLGWWNHGHALVEHCILQAGLSPTDKVKGEQQQQLGYMKTVGYMKK